VIVAKYSAYVTQSGSVVYVHDINSFGKFWVMTPGGIYGEVSDKAEFVRRATDTEEWVASIRPERIRKACNASYEVGFALLRRLRTELQDILSKEVPLSRGDLDAGAALEKTIGDLESAVKALGEIYWG
jgi:hypothetical protein